MSTRATSHPNRWRRALDLSALSTMVLAVPWLVMSLAVVALLALIGGEAYVGWACLAWLLSGVLVVVPTTEDVLARVMFRLRRPTQSERARLEAAWSGVLTAAGVPKNRYRLWVEDSAAVNAYATGGHIVAVTRRALTTLPPRQLEAVLAHELGHHLGGHAWTSLVTYWYSLPARLAWRTIRLVTRVVLAIVAIFSTVGYLVGLLVICLAGVTYLGTALHSRNLFLQFILLGPLLAPVVVAWFRRRGELAADRTATSLGYGPDLLAVLQQWQEDGHDDAMQRTARHRRLFATHPLTANRIRAVQRHLDATPQPPQQKAAHG